MTNGNKCTFYDLRELCIQYGVEVDYVPGKICYRLYVWGSGVSFPHTLATIPLHELDAMSHATLESVVISASLDALTVNG